MEPDEILELPELFEQLNAGRGFAEAWEMEHEEEVYPE